MRDVNQRHILNYLNRRRRLVEGEHNSERRGLRCATFSKPAAHRVPHIESVYTYACLRVFGPISGRIATRQRGDADHSRARASRILRASSMKNSGDGGIQGTATIKKEQLSRKVT